MDHFDSYRDSSHDYTTEETFCICLGVETWYICNIVHRADVSIFKICVNESPPSSSRSICFDVPTAFVLNILSLSPSSYDDWLIILRIFWRSENLRTLLHDSFRIIGFLVTFFLYIWYIFLCICGNSHSQFGFATVIVSFNDHNLINKWPRD